MEKAKKTARNWYHQAANDADRIFFLLLYPALLLPVLAELFSLQKRNGPSADWLRSLFPRDGLWPFPLWCCWVIPASPTLLS